MTAKSRQPPGGRAPTPKVTFRWPDVPKPVVPDSDQLIVTLTVGQLRQLVREGVLDAIADGPPQGPALLDKAAFARAIGVSTSTVDKLRKLGCPVVWVIESPRFDLAACMEWLRQQKA